MRQYDYYRESKYFLILNLFAILEVYPVFVGQIYPLSLYIGK